MAALADPDVEWVVARQHPAADTHRGREAIMAYLEDWRQTMPEMSYEAEEVVEDADRVLAVGRLRGAGLGSGADVEVRIATIATFEGNRVVRVEEFLDPDEARAALHRVNSPRNGEVDDRPPK